MSAKTQTAKKAAPAKKDVFVYANPFPKGHDDTKYRLVAGPKGFVKKAKFAGQDDARRGARRRSRSSPTRRCATSRSCSGRSTSSRSRRSCTIPAASPNDRFMATTLLRNAVVSAKFELPFCQDTGTATVVAWKGQQVWTGADDAEKISKGIWQTYTQENLRYSQTAALNMYDEVNTGNNLPAQIDIYATKGDAYKFLFVAKGGGSANKTYLFQETKALLNPASLEAFLVEKMKTLGTAACPPYHIVFVVGGTSAEACLKTVKLASTGYYDSLPTTGDKYGRAFRDPELEKKLLERAQGLGFGAQFGGKYFAHDVRVIRLPRHGASCPVGMGVSCSADRNVLAKIDAKGLWLEELERHPETLLPVAHGREGARGHRQDRPEQADEGDPRGALEAPRLDAARSHGPPRRRARHRAREAQGAPRLRAGPPAVLQGPPRLLRGPREDAEGQALRLVRADDGRPHGLVRRPLPDARAARWS